MFLSQILDGVRVTKLFSMAYGRTLILDDVQVAGIQDDSRKVRIGDLFVAMPGTAHDGHAFIDNAISNGAVAVLVQDDRARPDAFFLHTGVIKIVVPEVRRALGRIAANFYGRPSHRVRLIGVTGTNGKTTTTHLIKSVMESAGESVGLIGTIEHLVGEERIPATHTTPDAIELNSLLARMVKAGCRSVVMEVSSHALAQRRVEGLEFQMAVFTNLTQDHLDYHGTMKEYFRAKKILFDGLGPSAFAVTNLDDPNGGLIVDGCAARVISYAVSARAEVRARDIDLAIDGVRFLIEEGGKRTAIRSPLTGKFNVSNLLAAYAAGRGLGISPETIAQGICAVKAVRGRFEQLVAPAGWTAVIDYAHTPDALENCLTAIHDIAGPGHQGRVITIFGCGGNRDAGKRPLMGAIASRLSDVVVLTSDNPRDEDPDEIIDQIAGGLVAGPEVRKESDRRKAIVLGLSMARRGDVVLIAGKGHETYQIVRDTRMHFSDREEVQDYITRHE